MHKLEQHITPLLNDEGFRLVFISKADFGNGTQIAIEHHDGKTPSMGDCARLHRLLRAYLVQKSVINEKAALEVCSPGLDRPLITKEDYVRFKGHRVAVTLHEALGDHKTLKGELHDLHNGEVIIKISQDERIPVAFSNIRHCKLIPIL